MIGPGGTVFLDGHAAVVLAAADVDTWNPDTGERHQQATVISFGPPSGRDAVRTPTLHTITLTGTEQTTPPRSRHHETRWLSMWLGTRKRALDTAQTDMLRALIELEGLAS